MDKKRIIFLVVIIILVALLIYFIAFYTKKCSDASCFSTAQAKCSKASYVSDAEDAAWSYEIEGKDNGECVIGVELVQAKQGNVELEKLEGLEMECSVPLGYSGSPQTDLKKCHGLLKEELQELLIQRMHNYILNNLGKIEDALQSVI